jgi:hypothetical protein
VVPKYYNRLELLYNVRSVARLYVCVRKMKPRFLKRGEVLTGLVISNSSGIVYIGHKSREGGREIFLLRNAEAGIVFSALIRPKDGYEFFEF